MRKIWYSSYVNQYLSGGKLQQVIKKYDHRILLKPEHFLGIAMLGKKRPCCIQVGPILTVGLLMLRHQACSFSGELGIVGHDAALPIVTKNLKCHS